ncbi:hypothetical protein FH608_013980 [Nonomuraea phyllanthi]|uniref:Uncharacterized protein n=1 Tax=Nonomuraea phyllanthi TaxID=2219224 RepID=A0A5C4WRE4_9ACTN|nr:hypothetical protein [Nonomuraea phyllanthi]KAB8195442.1 hypothetical protein FH608_013980 [Nonomuraea phyllanthi]QFY10424.1 hypothetical protein GBF35_30825 [Nonomuraea phyllanthi]
MNRLFAVLAVASAAAALPIVTSGPAAAEDAPTVTILTCTIRGGAVLPTASSPTNLRCLGGKFHGYAVRGVI